MLEVLEKDSVILHELFLLFLLHEAEVDAGLCDRKLHLQVDEVGDLTLELEVYLLQCLYRLLSKNVLVLAELLD